jgi:hypothetical protein
MTLTCLLLAAALPAQAPADDAGPKPESAAERLEFMKASARAFRFRRGTGDQSFELQAEPAFRLGKQYTDVLEGAIFFWLGDGGRPEASMQLFKLQYAGGPPGGVWIHSFSSLSPGTFTVERDGRTVWNPATPGVELRPVAGAPRPAESAAQRSRQMRAMAKEFAASDDFRKNGWLDLRLLPTPIARYGGAGTKVVDGALFAFVEGTDPEVFLFLEARPGEGGMVWQYALAPMTVFAVKATHRGTTVWELPDRKPAKDPSKTYFDLVDKPSRP